MCLMTPIQVRCNTLVCAVCAMCAEIQILVIRQLTNRLILLQCYYFASYIKQIGEMPPERLAFL